VSNQPKPAEIIKLLFRRPKTAFSIIKLGATGLGPATKAAEKGDMEKAMKLFGKASLGKGKYEKMTASTKEKILENLTASEFTGSGFLPIDEKKLTEIQVPVLLLTGGKSLKLYAYLKDRLEELLPDCAHTEIPGASHIMQQDNPDAFNRAVKSFLEVK
jgi:pimeloyl-ACP methyl ester carboxylesterase